MCGSRSVTGAAFYKNETARERKNFSKNARFIVAIEGDLC